MNLFDLPYDGKATNKNGKIYSEVKTAISEYQSVPCPKISLPWMEKERRDFSYASGRLDCRFRTDRLEKNMTTSLGTYYENRLCETVVGTLLRKYLSKNDPTSDFRYASKNDDYSGNDFFISQLGSSVGIDLTTTRGKI